jgi:hypothetical protein
MQGEIERGALEKRAADHTRVFEKIADQQKRVCVKVDAVKLEYEYAKAEASESSRLSPCFRRAWTASIPACILDLF